MTFDLTALRPELRRFVTFGGRFGSVFDHPLHSQIGLESLAGEPSGHRASGLDCINDIVEEKTRLLDQARAERDWNSFVFLHQRPYRIDALAEVMEVERPSRLWPLVGDVWLDSAAPSDSEDLWEEVWSRAFTQSGKRRKTSLRVMSPAERRALDELPETITVWRGCSREGAVDGFSWTLDREMAIWFAYRFGGRGDEPAILAEVSVSKESVLAYFERRRESEVVLWPWQCMGATWEMLPRKAQQAA